MGNLVIKPSNKVNIIYPEVVDVYFAKKVEENGAVKFEKIEKGFLNTLMYIVIETNHIEEGFSLKINVFQYLAKDGKVHKRDTKEKNLDVKVGNYKNKGGTATQAIFEIMLGFDNKNDLPCYCLFSKENRLYVTLSIEANNDEKNYKTICYNLKKYKYNYIDDPNFWYAENRFELEKRKPIIVIDPGHGYTKGTTGAVCRIYTHKVKDNNGNPMKDDKGNFINRTSDIMQLPQYVIDDYNSWVISEKEDTNRNERGLVFDVSLKLVQLLKSKGYDCILTRTERVINGNDNITTRAERIKKANDNAADYFISIHADGGKFTSTGSHTIYPDTSDNDVLTKSKKLAEDIFKYYDVVNVDKESPKKDVRGIQILKSSNKTKRMVLVELGFLTNPQDAKKMFSNIDKIAEQLAKGLLYNIENDF